MKLADRRAPRKISARTGLRIGVAALASGALVTSAALALAGPASAATRSASTATGYQFLTLNNNHDVTFNQLLGINNEGVIAGYFGSGTKGHPNKGYELLPPFAQNDYRNENFPHSVQTQVIGLNDRGVTVGFWSKMNNANLINDNFGFYSVGGHFYNVNFPTGFNANPPVNNLLGVNNNDIAVGFYTNANGSNRGYEYNINTKKFTRVLPPGFQGNPTPSPSLTAAGINNHGDVAGFYNKTATQVDAFEQTHTGTFITLAFPGAAMTQAFGINDSGEVVGAYTVGTGNAAQTHGFTWRAGHGFTTVDDPNGAGTTTINGVNDEGGLVGFYTDGAGNVDGFLAAPARRTVVHLNLSPMPAGALTVGHGNARLSVSGLTPGSAHAVELTKGSAVAVLGTLTADGTGRASATAPVSSVPSGSRVVILNAGAGTDPIAQTSPLGGGARYPLHAIEAGAHGSLAGRATIVVDPATQTISVTVDATGLTPGAHAAHIHLGSCQSQGGVQYMLMDFTANGRGTIGHETRTVTGVTSVTLNGGWYLNLHQGNSSNILQNGKPTILFRPLLCANI
ncbi:MAG: CHRD domain-containing protein [Streptosporangiaceae bacterium]|nr:CHRD domain-containing protein [Streptosporangiaceae bacterium]